MLFDDILKISLGAFLAIFGGFLANIILKIIDQKRESFHYQRELFENALHDLLDFHRGRSDLLWATSNVFSGATTGKIDPITEDSANKLKADVSGLEHRIMKIILPVKLYQPSYLSVFLVVQINLLELRTKLASLQSLILMYSVPPNIQKTILADDYIAWEYVTSRRPDAEWVEASDLEHLFVTLRDGDFGELGRLIGVCEQKLEMILVKEYSSFWSFLRAKKQKGGQTESKEKEATDK